MNKQEIIDCINYCDDLGFDKHRNEFFFRIRIKPFDYKEHFVSEIDLMSVHKELPALINYLIRSGRPDKPLDLWLTLNFWRHPENCIVLPGNHYRTRPVAASVSKRARGCFILVCQQFNLIKLPDGNTMAQGKYPEPYLQDRLWMDKYYPGAANKIEQLEALGCTDDNEIARLVFVDAPSVVESANLGAVNFI